MNAHAPIYGAEERQEERAATLSGLMGLLLVSLRVARSSQPWAERCNPFGIERRGPARQKLVASGLQTCAAICEKCMPHRKTPMRLTILSVAYPLARVGPDAVGGAEQVLTQLDAALTQAGHRSLVIA